MKKFFRLVSMLAVAGLTFTYTSCTDYSEDINKVDGRVDDLQSQFDAFKSATNESIEKINGLVADLQKTVATLETKEDHKKDVDALNELIKGLKTDATALAGRVEAIEKDLPNYVKKTDLNKTLEGYVKVADFNTKIGEITGRLEAIEGTLNKYDSDLKISDILNQISDVKSTADDASQKVGALRTDVDVLQKALAGYTEAGAIQTKFNTIDEEVAKKLNITDFKTELEKYFRGEFDEAFKEAIKISCEKDGDVYKAIYAALNPALVELNGKISNLDAKINDVLGIVLNRIQSIVFVPEYDDMCASLYYYYIFNDGKSYPLSDKTVVASFEVYPRTQAENVADMLKNGGASVVAVPLKHSFTRGAAEAAVATIKTAVAVNGIVKVEAVFGEDVDYELPDYPGSTPIISSAADHASSFAIALRVEAPAKDEIETGKDEEGNAISTTIDAGKYIESAYVPVRLSAGSDLSDAFAIYDFEKEDEFPDNVKIQKEWSDAPAVWNYFKGYEYAVYIADFRNGETFEDAKYRTIAEAAAIMNVDPAKITPAMTVAAAADPKASAKFFSKVDFEKTLPAAYIAMDEKEVTSNPKAAVGSHMIHTASFSLAGVKNVILPRVADYEIIRRKVTFDVTPYDANRIDWSYKTAKELTKDITSGVAYDNDITFDECYVTKKESSESKYPETAVTLGDILKLAPSYKVTSTINDKTVDVPVTKTPVTITKVADKVEDVAKVVIKGSTYNFSQLGDNKYVVEAIYAVDDNQTDYIINFEYVLGKMAEDQTVTLPAKTFKFNSKDASFKVSYTVDEYRKPLVDAIGGYFADAKTLWASVNEEKVIKNQTVNAVIDGKKITSFPASATAINVTDAGVNVVVDRNDLKTFEDTFSYEATCETWYGVTYTFETASALTFVKPDFRLAPAPDRLNDDWTGTILHEAKYDKYVLKQDIDLSKYVIVDNYDGKEETLTIEYAQKTKADVANGIVNVPSIVTTPVKVIPNAASPAFPTIEESLINWLKNPRADSFTARYDEITAVLKFDGIKLDEKVMKLSTARPITKFAFDDVKKVVPVGSTGETVKLWNNMIIEGVLEEGNVVKQDAVSLEKALAPVLPVGSLRSTADTYDCEVIFPATKDVEVYVGGEKQSIYNLTKFNYDQEKGIITFTGDLSDLVKPVEFKFTAKLNYVLDKVHHDQLEAKVSVTFQK